MSGAGDPTKRLAGCGIVVTRPSEQAESMCEAIELAGGRAIRFPVLEILDPTDAEAMRMVIERLDAYDECTNHDHADGRDAHEQILHCL